MSTLAIILALNEIKKRLSYWPCLRLENMIRATSNI